MKHADVVISGSGMVRLPLALALAQGGLKTVVVDAAPPTGVLDPKFDGQVSALAYASVRMLKALGVWEGLEPHALAIHEILVTDGAQGEPASPLFSLHFDAEEIGAAALGHIAENRHIRAALHQAVALSPNLELAAPASVQSLAMESGGATVKRWRTAKTSTSGAGDRGRPGRESRLRGGSGQG